MATKTVKKSSGSSRETEKIKCRICEKSKAIANNYFSSTRSEYNERGYCDICKSCLIDMMVNPETGLINKDNFRNEICFYLDMPFIPALYIKLSKDESVNKGNFIGKYRSQLNLNSEWKNFKYADSSRFLNAKDEALFLNKDEEVTAEMVEFWGDGHSTKYYLQAQKKYDDFMINENENEIDYKKQSDYKFLVQMELKKDEMVADPAVKASELRAIQDTISKISQDLNIKIVQKNEDRLNKDHFRAGLTTKWIEDVKKEPIPFFEEWYGKNFFSGFKELAQLYILGPLMEAIGIRNPFKQEWEDDKKRYEPSKDELDREKEPDDDEFELMFKDTSEIASDDEIDGDNDG